MTEGQSPMYFAEWNKARKALREFGRSPVEADAMRMKIHVKVGAVDRLGQPKSSKVLNNRDIDRCLAEFWVWSQPGNLELQLRQLDQPYTRAMGSQNAVFFLNEIGVKEDDRKRYLTTICQRIFKKDLADLDDSEWPDILGALNHTRMHKKGIAHRHKRKPKPGVAPVGLEAPTDAAWPVSPGTVQISSSDDEGRAFDELLGERQEAPPATGGGLDDNTPF